MRYLHTMIRAANLEQTLHFFVDQLGLVEAYRMTMRLGDSPSFFSVRQAISTTRKHNKRHWSKLLITGIQKPTTVAGILVTWRIKSTIFITLASS